MNTFLELRYVVCINKLLLYFKQAVIISQRLYPIVQQYKNNVDALIINSGAHHLPKILMVSVFYYKCLGMYLTY